MRASGLGKVSRDKRRRASTSDNTIAAVRDERNRRRSHREAPKRSRHKPPLEREEEGRGDQLRSHKRPRQRARQERREGVVSITTKLILRRQLLSQVRQSPQNKRDERSREARQPYQRETPGRSGKYMPLISHDASVGINKKTKSQTTTTKTTSKNRAINAHHHDDRRHSSEHESRDDPRKFRHQRRQREREQEQRLLVRW